jgi:TonB family protein
LEILFRENPKLIPDTIFLAEGAEADQQVSVASLVAAAPEPSESLIRTVLESFLIPGYLAYEWKHQHGIPTVGTEEKQLYDISSTLWTAEDWPLWPLSVVARNHSLAQTLIDKVGQYANPILFTGWMHLHPLAQETYETAKRSLSKHLPLERVEYIRTSENLGIKNYLEREKIGYTFLGVDTQTPPEAERKYTDRYRQLFKAQQREDYESYIHSVVLDLPSVKTEIEQSLTASLTSKQSVIDHSRTMLNDLTPPQLPRFVPPSQPYTDGLIPGKYAALPSKQSGRESLPHFVYQPKPDYPLIARRRGWEGTVILAMELLADGTIGEVRIANSSGYPLLDEAAKQAVQQWRHTPAMRKGAPVTRWAKQPISFNLD